MQFVPDWMKMNQHINLANLTSNFPPRLFFFVVISHRGLDMDGPEVWNARVTVC